MYESVLLIKISSARIPFPFQSMQWIFFFHEPEESSKRIIASFCFCHIERFCLNNSEGSTYKHSNGPSDRMTAIGRHAHLMYDTLA